MNLLKYTGAQILQSAIIKDRGIEEFKENALCGVT